MLLDTTFLIDLQREAHRRQPGPACRFLRAHPDEPVRISVLTWGEFAEGFGPDGEQTCADTLRPYPTLPLSAAIAWRYGQLSRQLRERGERIGDNDLWIAATALHHDLELVTRNGDLLPPRSRAARADLLIRLPPASAWRSHQSSFPRTGRQRTFRPGACPVAAQLAAYSEWARTF